ncbi:MAG TPA: hypothetical protein VEK07_10020 [Polyangiaceae bacterium]|nr:hypothetical protein [Polyangiaceae bacterium]
MRLLRVVRLCDASIVGSGVEQGRLHGFRVEWVHGHLDTQRATEALEAAQRDWQRVRDGAGVHFDDEELRRTQHGVDAASERLAQVKAVLAEQFDRFCG